MRISDWSSDVCSSDLRLLLLACKGGLDLPLALGRQALRLGLGAGDDLLGLLYRLALLALVAGEQRLRLLAQALRLFDLGPDLRDTGIQAAEDRPFRGLEDGDDEDHEGDRKSTRLNSSH